MGKELIAEMILIFDFFQTLLYSKSVDFNRGLKVLWEKHYKDKCNFEAMKAYGEELFRHLLSLHAEGKEFAFVKEELPLYARKFGGNVISMSAQEEADFLMLCNELEICSGVESFLESCFQKNIPMYVVSNSGFGAEALKIVLDRFEIGKYFRRVWSSADFGRIKPCKEFLELAIQTALSENPMEDKGSIIYVGDLYETDVVGASGAGIKAAWLNKKGEEDADGLATYIVTMFEELAELI